MFLVVILLRLWAFVTYVIDKVVTLVGDKIVEFFFKSLVSIINANWSIVKWLALLPSRVGEWSIWVRGWFLVSPNRLCIHDRASIRPFVTAYLGNLRIGFLWFFAQSYTLMSLKNVPSAFFEKNSFAPQGWGFYPKLPPSAKMA